MGDYKAAWGGNWRYFARIVEAIGRVPDVRVLSSHPEFMVVFFNAEDPAAAQKVADLFPVREGFVICLTTYKKFEPDGSSGL